MRAFVYMSLTLIGTGFRLRGRLGGKRPEPPMRPPKQAPPPPTPNAGTICVMGVPQEMNTIEQLNEHFKRFGNILNIVIKQDTQTAFIKFAEHPSAVAAIESPDAVFGNRFIRVNWAHRQDSDDTVCDRMMAYGLLWVVLIYHGYVFVVWLGFLSLPLL